MKAKNSLVSKTNGLSLGEMHKNNKYVLLSAQQIDMTNILTRM